MWELSTIPTFTHLVYMKVWFQPPSFDINFPFFAICDRHIMIRCVLLLYFRFVVLIANFLFLAICGYLTDMIRLSDNFKLHVRCFSYIE